ncbi:hypothetical protein E5P55_00130 [Candidatus Pinguicoccus supinus]|uniref:Methionyl/Leucyl tRNA synthetase domain-containing protein n=1 Tax=Candidatus Pinguicoccus supinus TaxID=2529394 RepID=A0A7T0BRU5_9BACT|nr:hypothetical protein E5P55_00130 [Candidatus Pinguicoccus supinus]
MPKFNKTTVFYVWFDALINYITVSGFGNKKFNIN